MRVLLVEDNEMNRDMLSRRLARRGYDVTLASDAETALTLARSDPAPDIILMDISLPGMDGWEATRHLKGDPTTRRIPVIALTAHALNADRDSSIAAGCDGFETKPVDLASLTGRMEELAGRDLQ